MSLELPFGIRVKNQKPADAKYFNTSGTPYTSTAQVLSQVPTGERHIGLLFNVNGIEYWFDGGILDTDLKLKSSSGGGGGFPASDADFSIYSDADNSKFLNLDLSQITTSTTRTLIIPDADGTIALLSDIPSTITASDNVAWTGTHSFLDSNFSLLDNDDTSKIAKFELSGLTAGTTTYILPASNGIIALRPNIRQITLTANNYTLLESDYGQVLEVDNGATAATVTLPVGLSEDWNCTIVNRGTGIVTLITSGGSILNSDGVTIEVQYTGVTVYHRGSNVFVSLGALGSPLTLDNITGTVGIAQIEDDAVTYAKLQNVAANSFLANVTGSAANVQEISTTRIPLFGSAITGTPDNTNFLRGDGSWQTISTSTDFADNVFRVSDNTDATKKLAFELSGVSASTVRTLTVPNADGTIALVSDIPSAFALTNGNGTTANGTAVDLGGILTTNTEIEVDDKFMEIGVFNGGVLSFISNYHGIALSDLTNTLTIGGSNINFSFGYLDNDSAFGITDSRTVKRGLQYTADYTSTFTDLSIPNWKSVLHANTNTVLDENVNTGITIGAGGGFIIQGSTSSFNVFDSYIRIGSNNEFIDYGTVLTISSLNGEGIKYGADYTSTFVARSLVSKGYVDGRLANKVISAPTVAQDLQSIRWNNTGNTWEYFTPSSGGYTNLTQFVDQTAWRGFYSDAFGDVQELAFGAAGTVYKSAGTGAVPIWEYTNPVVTRSLTTNNYTLVAADHGKIIELDNGATAGTITLPSGLPNSFSCTVVNRGTGILTLQTSGSTLTSEDTTLEVRYTGVTIYHSSGNAFTAMGSLGEPLTLDNITGLLDISKIEASGTPSVSTYLRGDGSWATVSGGVSDGDKGDITVSASGATWTVDNSAVTLAKMANVAADTIFYRKTAGSGAPEVQTLATLKTDLGLTGTNSGDQTSIVGITGTKAQFDTAVTDGNFLFVGDITQYTDELAQDAVGAMIDTTLVYVDATPLLTRAALTGAITAAQGSNTTALGSFTKTQLSTAVSDGTVMFVGDAPTAHTHVTADITDLSSYTGFDARYYTETETNNLLSGKWGLTGTSTITGNTVIDGDNFTLNINDFQQIDLGIRAAGGEFSTMQMGTNFANIRVDGLLGIYSSVSLEPTAALIISSSSEYNNFVVANSGHSRMYANSNGTSVREFIVTSTTVTIEAPIGGAAFAGIQEAVDFKDNYTGLSLTNKNYTDANLLGLPLAAPTGAQVGQSIRWNAGGTAWEYFTAVGGTPAGATNEIQKNDGGTFAGTKLFSTADGNFTLGDSGLAGSQRVILPEGSATDVGLQIQTKGAGDLLLLGNVRSGLAGDIEIRTETSIASDAGRIYIKGGNAPSGGYNGGDVILQSGSSTTGGGTVRSIIALSSTAANSYLPTIYTGVNRPTFNSVVSSSSTNTSDYPFRVTHITGNTPIAGFGVGIEFDSQTDVGGNRERLAQLTAVLTGVTGGSETSDFIISTATGGTLTDKFRITSESSIILTNRSGDVATPENGEIWYDSTANKFRARQNGTSVDLIGAGGGSSAGIITFVLFNGGDDLTTGIKDVPIPMPTGFTVTAWEIMAYDGNNALVSTSAVVDILADTFANLPLDGAADSICTTEKPTLSAASTATDTSITWTAIVAGEYVQAEIESISAGVKKLVVVIKGTKA